MNKQIKINKLLGGCKILKPFQNVNGAKGKRIYVQNEVKPIKGV